MFYISTPGSSASVWLARALNLHPEIYCLHGVHALLPGQPPVSPQEFVDALVHLHVLSQGMKIVGSVHGFRSDNIAPAIEEVGGFLATMIRHPIARINSLFHREAMLIGEIDLPQDDIFRPFRSDRYVDLSWDGKSFRFDAYANCFYGLCNKTIFEDVWAIDAMDEARIFRYEELVFDRHYFQTCFELIAEGCRQFMEAHPQPGDVPRLQCAESYLDKVFGMGVVNRKSTGARDPLAIFAAWPDFFKQLFAMSIKTIGGAEVVERYAQFGYALPKLFESGHRSAAERVPIAAPVQAEYQSIGTVAALMPERIEHVRRMHGAAFLGYQYSPSRRGAKVKIGVTANAYSDEDNAVAIAVFVGQHLRPVHFEIKPVVAKGWVHFEHALVAQYNGTHGLSIQVRICPIHPGTIVINGLDGEPPSDIGRPTLSIAELDEAALDSAVAPDGAPEPEPRDAAIDSAKVINLRA